MVAPCEGCNTDERKSLFEAAIPAFANGDARAVDELSGIFDVVYNKFVALFSGKLTSTETGLSKSPWHDGAG